MSACFLVLALALCAWLPWGPGNHLEFASRVLRARRKLASEPARLLRDERAAYLYGNIAADIINFKGYGGHYNHCHRWTIVAEMRARAESPAEQAFALGYLSHLAADTIAHNHFVPYHLARFARTRGLGHLYWEMSADRFVPESRWTIVTRLKAQPELTELDELVNRTVPKKAFSMGTNKLIFNHVLLVSERQRWRRGMQELHPLGEIRLSPGFLALFQTAAVDRIRLALHPRGFRAIQSVDANGKEAQSRAMKLRKGWLARLHPRRVDPLESEALAAPFLEGMQSPP